jgi:hypothetical protein
MGKCENQKLVASINSGPGCRAQSGIDRDETEEREACVEIHRNERGRRNR